jgi:hypothetical protein
VMFKTGVIEAGCSKGWEWALWQIDP